MTITPASIRNNNPGAMYPGPSAKRFGATSHEVLRSKDGVHKIATFPTPIHGAAAQFDLLDRRYTGLTIRAAITRWCGGFYAGTYIKVLKSQANVDPDDRLTKSLVRNPDAAIPLAKAMAWQEAGRKFPLDDEGWRTAHAMAFSDAKAPAFAPDNDVPAPKPETRTAAVLDKIKHGAAVATGGVAAGGAVVPGVPQAVTDTATNVSAWQAIGTQIVGAVSWIGSHPIAALGVVLIGLAVFLVPRRAA